MDIPVISPLWKAFSAVCDKVYKRPGVLPMKTMEFETYMVKDSETAGQLRNWAEQRSQAEEAIDDFLSQEFMVKYFKISGPIYKLDETGHIDCVRPRDWMPITLAGWEGISPNSNWLAPEGRPGSTRSSDEGNRLLEIISNLPPVPNHDPVKNLINWPDLQYSEDEEAGMEEDDILFARGTDHLISAFSHGRYTFIEVPAPSALSKYPVLQERLEKWEKPEFLKPVSERYLARLKEHAKQLERERSHSQIQGPGQ